MKTACARAEILAGAIALGEATDPERDEYRRHIAACAPCVQSLGGEREIERVMHTVVQAREMETWQPLVPSFAARRARVARSLARVGLWSVVVALALSLAVHVLVAAAIRPMDVARAGAPKVATGIMHVTFEHRAGTPAVVPAPHPRPLRPARVVTPSLVVVHNVITLKAPERIADRHAEKTLPAAETRITTTQVASLSAGPANVPIWRRGSALPRAHAAPPILQGRAESIAIAPNTVIRDVSPLGGDAAINPRPPLIAYSQGAQGTTAFEVSVDDRGVPRRCTITKSSGFLSLDGAVCAAAMHARYAPRTVNGRPTPGVYRDAFTFRAEQTDTTSLPEMQ